MAKADQVFADTLPLYLRRACGCMSADGGLRDWLDARFGAGKWSIAPPKEGATTILSNHEYGDLAVEYGYGRLVAMFGNAPSLFDFAPPAILPQQQNTTQEKT